MKKVKAIPEGWDFSGWATKNDLKCADNLVIKHGAFSDCDMTQVPLIWNHQHGSNEFLIGHVILKEKPEGMYGYGYLNNTARGKDAKENLRHNDADSLSIYANEIVKNGNEVVHGMIKEVSLVIAAANPGAIIESVIAHGISIDDDEDEAIIYTGDLIELNGGIDTVSHSEDDTKKTNDEDEEEEDEEDDTDDEDDGSSDKNAAKQLNKEQVIDRIKHYVDLREIERETKTSNKDTIKHSSEREDSKNEEQEADKGKKTIGEVIDTMTEEQKAVLKQLMAASAMAGGATTMVADIDKEEKKDMKHNIFDSDAQAEDTVISHSDMVEILKNGQRKGSLRDAFNEFAGDDGVLAHSLDTTGMTVSDNNQAYGINDPSFLYPEFKTLNNPPEWISRNMDWVSNVLGSVHRTPFTRIKSVFADITEDAARARGYIKGRQKKEEVFSLLKRTTNAQMIYKKQKMDRDDISEITDFDVVAWIKAEMRVMLNEEIARAILIGDGRLASDDDKISPDNVRPIVTDVPLFNITDTVDVPATATDADIADAVLDQALLSRVNYKGSGNLTFYTTETMLTKFLLLKDGVGHRMFKSEAELATALRVKDIITVEPMEGHTVSHNVGGSDKDLPLIGVFVNLKDYNVGTNNGGGINFFSDFDIDYNREKYLIETKISGALIKPFSAITLLLNKAE